MKILITGARGMLGRTLIRRLDKYELIGVDRSHADLTNPAQVNEMIKTVRPDVIIHTAAMTAVDKCEVNRESAFAANELASANVAQACESTGARCIAISTDYVFSGDLDRPYHESDEREPRTVYGKSKLAGEQAIQRICSNHTILRVAWLYGQGGPSFLHSMIKLASESNVPLKVVNDQVGNPTSTDVIAEQLDIILKYPVPGVIHASCSGEASWYDFATEIFLRMGFDRQIVPCTTAQFPRPAPRPVNSRLDNRVMRLAGLPTMPNWRHALERYLREHSNG